LQCTHAAEGAALGGESSFSGGEGAVDDVFEVGVYVPRREKGGVVQREAACGVFPYVVFYVYSLACQAALAGGCLRLRALRMRVRCRTASWSKGMRESCREYMSGCGFDI